MFNAYNPQIAMDRIDNQIAELQKMKSQIPPVPAINQTFQLASNNSSMKFLNSLDEVNKELVFGTTPFFSKDMSVLWVKEASGEVKSYELKEIVEKDEKDLKIELLMAQVEELKKGMIKDEQRNANVDGSVEEPKSSNGSTIRGTKKK